VILTHENGILSNLHLAVGAPTTQPCERYVVFGERGTAEVENSRCVRFRRGASVTPDGVSFAADGLDGGALVWEAQDSFSTVECRSELTQGIYLGLHHFLRCVLDGCPSELGGLEFARHVTELQEAALRSDGQPVAVGGQ
jgi:hypothetical protein